MVSKNESDSLENKLSEKDFFDFSKFTNLLCKIVSYFCNTAFANEPNGKNTILNTEPQQK